MREKIAPREFWNRRSQHYDGQSGAAYADAYRKTAECIRPYLTPNDRVLDFACGTGLVTLPVAQMAAEVCAIDISDEMVRHLKKKIAEQGVGNVSASCMDLFDESLRPGSFDAVVDCSTSKTARRCSRASMSCCGRREYSFRRRTAWASGSHARAFASGGAATRGKCPMCRLTVCTRWRRPSPRLALRCWRPKTCFPRRRTSLSQQEKSERTQERGPLARAPLALRRSIC